MVATRASILGSRPGTAGSRSIESNESAVDTDIQRYYPGRIVTNDTYQVRLGIVRLTILAAIVIVRLIVNRAIADIKNEHVSIQRME